MFCYGNLRYFVIGFVKIIYEIHYQKEITQIGVSCRYPQLRHSYQSFRGLCCEDVPLHQFAPSVHCVLQRNIRVDYKF